MVMKVSLSILVHIIYYQPLDNKKEDIPLFERNLPVYNINQTNISINSYITKYYKPKVKITKQMTINEIKNKIMKTDNDVEICKLLGSLHLRRRNTNIRKCIRINLSKFE